MISIDSLMVCLSHSNIIHYGCDFECSFPRGISPVPKLNSWFNWILKMKICFSRKRNWSDWKLDFIVDLFKIIFFWCEIYYTYIIYPWIFLAHEFPYKSNYFVLFFLRIYDDTSVQLFICYFIYIFEKLVLSFKPKMSSHHIIEIKWRKFQMESEKRTYVFTLNRYINKMKCIYQIQSDDKNSKEKSEQKRKKKRKEKQIWLKLI